MSKPDDPNKPSRSISLSKDEVPAPKAAEFAAESGEAKGKGDTNLNSLITAAFSDAVAKAPKTKPAEGLRFDHGPSADFFVPPKNDRDAHGGDIEAVVGRRKPLMVGSVAMIEFVNPRRTLTFLFSAVLVAGLFLWLRPPAWFEPIRDKMRQGGAALRQSATGKMSFTRALQEIKGAFATSKQPVAVISPTSATTSPGAVLPGICQKAIENFKIKNAASDSLLVGQCHLVFDDPLRAFSLLKTFHERLPIKPNRGGYLNSLSAENFAGFLAGMVALARLGRQDDLEKLIRPMCVQWTSSRDCLARLLYLNSAGFVSAGLQALAKMPVVSSEMGDEYRAFLFRIAGELHDKGGDYAQAAQYFLKALAATQSHKVFNSKLILEAHAFAAARHARIVDLAEVQKQSSRLLANEGRMARLKIQLVAGLFSKQASDVLKSALTKSDLNVRLRGDNRLLAVLGETAIRFDVAPMFARYAQLNTEQLRTAFLASAQPITQSEIWRARALISSGDTRQALALLATLARSSPKVSLPMHLRGVVLAKDSSQRRPDLVQARQAFEAAVGLDPHWSSLFALAHIYGNMRQVAKQQIAVQRIKSAAANQDAVFWLKIAQIELLSNKGSANQALAEVDRLLGSDPRSVAALQLRGAILRRLKREREAVQSEATAEKLLSSIEYIRSGEFKSNPLGALALL